MDEKEVQLIIQEKNLAIERYNQSKLLIEKLEQELQTLKSLQPTSSKNIINIVQKEYTEVINSLNNKLKTVQDKYKEEICSRSKKESEIILLTKRTDELNSRLIQIEKECYNCNNLLKQEREKYLTLENDYIRLQNESLSLGKKYSCVGILESEQNKLIDENRKLSNDCNELEIALEICHQKMRSYEEELSLYCKCLERIEHDKRIIESNEKTQKELNNELQERIEEMNLSIENLHKQLKTKDEQFRQNLKYLLQHFSMKSEFEKCDEVYHDKINSDNEFYEEFEKLRFTLLNYKKELQNYIRRKLDLEVKLKATILNMEKYRVYIKEANEMIMCLEKKLNEQEEIIKNNNPRKYIEKYAQKVGSTNVELQKQIYSQEELHKKWKSEVAELINRFKNRISSLNANYKKSQKENHKLKKSLNKYLLADEDINIPL